LLFFYRLAAFFCHKYYRASEIVKYSLPVAVTLKVSNAAIVVSKIGLAKIMLTSQIKFLSLLLNFIS